jgi:hypothetical protein
MTVPAPMVTGYIPWKTTLSAIVAVGSAFKGAFGGPELEEEDRWVFFGGLRVAILFVAWEFGGCLCGDPSLLIWGGLVLELSLAAFVVYLLVSNAELKQH